MSRFFHSIAREEFNRCARHNEQLCKDMLKTKIRSMEIISQSRELIAKLDKLLARRIGPPQSTASSRNPRAGEEGF